MILAATLYAVLALGISHTNDSRVVQSRRGSVATLVRDSPNDWRRHLLVIRADGSRVVIPRPSDRELVARFGHDCDPKAGPRDSSRCDKADFKDIALAADGTPVATVKSWFSGAWSGEYDRVFVWEGASWRDVVPTRFPIEADNFELGGVDTPQHLVLVPNFHDRLCNPDCHLKATPTGSLLLEKNRFFDLHFGASAMNGEFIVGRGPSVISSTGFETPVALLWRGTKIVRRWNGSASAVSSSGAVVGNDAVDAIAGSGYPMLWLNKAAIRLSNIHGRATFIAEDGTIIGYHLGQTEDTGFIVRGLDRGRHAIPFNDLLKDRTWHIVWPISIAADGTVLAVAHHKGPAYEYVLLKPIL